MAGEDGYDPDRIDFGDEEDEEEHKVVCLVDCHSTMFEAIKVAEGQDSTYFAEAMSFIEQHMRERIVTAANDEIAVVFYGTAKTGADAFPEVHALLPLDSPDAAGILKVANFTVEEFEKEFGRGSDDDAAMKLRDGLWATGQMFAERKGKADKSIYLFSNQEQPSGLTPDVMTQLELRVGDLKERGVTLELIPLISASRPFNAGRFWSKVITPLLNPDDSTASSASAGTGLITLPAENDASGWEERITSVLNSVRSRMRRKRAVYSMHWRISSELEISVQLFNLVMKVTRPTATKLHKATNAPLKSETSYICHDTGALLTSQDLKAFNMTNTSSYNERFPTVVLQSEEVAAIKAVKPTGLLLLGFKPVTCLKEYHQVKHSYFVYPNENDLKGSVVAFHALYRQMHKQEKMAVCRFVASSNGAPRLVALVAQAEVTDEYGVQMEPPGMQMILLPFVDDLRFPETSTTLLGSALPPPPSEELVDAAEALIMKLDLPTFSSTLIPNPELKRHYDVIEALALGKPIPEEDPAFYDATLPDPEFAGEAEAEVKAFKKLLYGGDGEPTQPEPAAKSRKRKADDDAPQDLKDAYAQHDWAGLAKSGALSKMTIANLKIYLQFNNLKVTGNKPDLLSRINEHLSDPGGAA